MKRTHYIIALVVASLDLLTKKWILARLTEFDTIEIVPGLFNIILVRNTGVAFGLFQGIDSPWKPVVLSVVALLAMGAIVYYGRLVTDGATWLQPALALVMGGIMGNFVDRVYRGSVVDFLDVYWRQYHWPTFNIADSAITLGICALLWDSVRAKPVVKEKA